MRRPCNEGAAGRNAGAQAARGDWLVMLDDDSWPLDTDFIEVLVSLPPQVAAVGADIRLPGGARESGGLPEVFVGCGAAIRTDVFRRVGGYDPSFEYYVEEYDLCARLLQSGLSVVHDRRFRVWHEKALAGRDFNRIIRSLVRNNVRVIERYAPPSRRTEAIQRTIERYRAIAEREAALDGFAAGLADLQVSAKVGTRPLTPEQYDRFTGLSHVRLTLGRSLQDIAGRTVTLIEPGKHAWVVAQVAKELGATIVDSPDRADLRVIATLSPGPMLDAYERASGVGDQPVLVPWCPTGDRESVLAGRHRAH